MRVNVVHLKKDYGPTRAVDDISFGFASGQIIGFVGPNGAGKTTTMRILATLEEPTAGDAFIDGISVVEEPERARRLVGYVPDDLPTHRDMSVRDYLDFYRARLSLARPAAAAGDPARRGVHQPHRHSRQVPGGAVQGDEAARQRGAIAAARSAGADHGRTDVRPRPARRVELRELLKLLSWQGKAILISSHILTELAEVCNAVIIIEHGKMLRAGTLEEVLAEDRPRRTIHIRLLERHTEVAAHLGRSVGVEKASVLMDNTVEVEVNGPEASCCDLLAGLVQSGFRVLEFRLRRADLEEVFMNVTKGEVQ